MSSSPNELRRTLTPAMLWGLGVGYVISGMYFGWNLGLAEGGTLGLAIATFFIISTVIIYSQFNSLMNFNIGYNDKHIVIVKPGDINIGKLDVIENELLKNSSIEKVSADQGGREGTVAHINDGKEIGFDIKHVDENYFSVFQIPIVKGRNFSKDFGSDTSQSAILN